MMTGAFSQNIGNLFSELKLVANNLVFHLWQQPTEKPLQMNSTFQSSNRDTLSQDTISLGEYMLVHALLFSDVLQYNCCS